MFVVWVTAASGAVEVRSVRYACVPSCSPVVVCGVFGVVHVERLMKRVGLLRALVITRRLAEVEVCIRRHWWKHLVCRSCSWSWRRGVGRGWLCGYVELVV